MVIDKLIPIMTIIFTWFKSLCFVMLFARQIKREKELDFVIIPIWETGKINHTKEKSPYFIKEAAYKALILMNA